MTDKTDIFITTIDFGFPNGRNQTSCPYMSLSVMTVSWLLDVAREIIMQYHYS